MKTRIIISLLTTFFLFTGIVKSFSQTAEQQYQKGLMQEEGEGNLEEAIKLFAGIVENQSADKTLQAKALLHVGLCYEKLGKEEATKAYQRLVNNFPAQKNEVAIARERLSRLILATGKVESEPLKPKFTKIRMPGSPGNGMVSPDGKKIAFISEGDVWVVPVSGGVNPYITGEPKRLTKNIGARDMSNSFCWSGNGKWIAFNAEMGNNSSETSIYVMPSEGGDVQKVEVPSHYCGWPAEFRLSLSPNGKILAYVSGWLDYSAKTSKIYTIPVSGGEAKELTEPGTLEPIWSPDGTKIVYVKSSIDGDRNHYSELVVIPAEGGTPKKLINRLNGQIRGPVWSPDSKKIAYIFRPEEENPKEIWIVPVTNEGDPSGTPRKVDLPLESYHAIAGWTPENKIGIQLMNPQYEVIYTVPSSGGIATQVTPQGWTSYPKWSPDGKRIFFRWDGGQIASVPFGGGAVDSIKIDSEFNIYTAVPGSGNEVSPDGKTIVFSGTKNFQKDGKKQWEVDIFTVPVKGGKPKQLTETAVELQDRFPCWSPDGTSIAFIRPEIIDTKYFMHIYTISRNGENLKKITVKADDVAWAPIDWTPDGKSITFFTNKNSIRSIPVEGGESILITEIDKVNSQFDLAWSPDGEILAYTDKGKLWKYIKESGKTVEVKTGVKTHATKIGWSPDGKKIAFTAFDGGDAELWLMENFLPLEKLAQNEETEAAKEPEGIKIRQIWKAPYLDDLGTVSLDGKYRSYVDWGVGNVGIHNLITDEKKVLSSDAKLGEAWQFAGSTVISGDGKKIVYSWANPYNTNSLRLINVENPEPELLYKKTGEEIYPSAWLSDNDIVAFRSIPETRTMQLVTFNIMDKKIKVKKTFLPGQFWGGACSPDKKYIAYGYANSADKGNTDIRLLEANGNLDIPLITHPSNDKVLGWVPERKEFLFISDRSGSWDLWAIKLDGTKPLGSAKRIYANIGEVDPMGFSQDGECYFGFSRRNFYSGLAPFNKETGEIDLGTSQAFEGQNFLMSWSPDGQYLAYIEIEDRSKGNPFKLFVQDVKSGEKFQPDNNTLRVSSCKWSPDGKTILVIGREMNKLQEKDYIGGIFMVDIKTGQIDQVLLLSEYEFNRPEDDSAPLSCVEWSPDKRNVYYLFQKDRLVNHNLETGEDKIIYEFSDFSPYILETSPDGKNLLFGLEYPDDKKSSLYTMPVEGGKEKMVCNSQEANRIIWAKYSPDGREIYFVELPEFDKSVLWRVPAEGGKPEKIWSPGKRVEIYDIHPDGNKVAFSIRERTTEVRVIENLKQELDKIYSQNE